MKNLYHKNKDKGKVYPSPSSSSSSSSSSAFAPNKDALSMLNLLPAAILALASVLSFEDREVLGYLISRSMKTTNPSSKKTEEKNKCKKTNNTHKQHLFDCGCFDCYTSYWFRWDSSPNRELIHQVIEAFEEYLTKGEFSKNNNYCRGKKKDKTSRRRTIIEKPPNKIPETPAPILPEPEKTYFVPKDDDDDDDIIPFVELDTAHEYVEEENKEDYKECEMMEEEVTGGELTTEEPPPANNNHKGLVSKVFPDVFGILNSRLWSLWSPNI